MRFCIIHGCIKRDAGPYTSRYFIIQCHYRTWQWHDAVDEENISVRWMYFINSTCCHNQSRRWLIIHEHTHHNVTCEMSWSVSAVGVWQGVLTPLTSLSPAPCQISYAWVAHTATEINFWCKVGASWQAWTFSCCFHRVVCNSICLCVSWQIIYLVNWTW